MAVEMKPSYFGKCYSCKKNKEIVSCITWSTQNDSMGRKVIGGFRPFCAECEKELGIGVNRAVNVKKLSDIKGKVDLSKYRKCSKCKMYYLTGCDYSTICTCCYGRAKNGSD